MDDEEAKPNDETMHGGRLSAAEKGKQKAADADVVDATQTRPPAGDAAANCHAGVPRHLLLGTPCGGTSEIEELPPSPPRAPSSSRPHLSALNAEEGVAAAGLAAVVVGPEGRLEEMQAALESRLRKLEQLRRESGGGSKRRREGADEPEPEVAGGGEVQTLQNHLGKMRGKVSGMKDAMLAFQFQAEEMRALKEFWNPVVPGRQPQRNKSKAELEQMKALEEFWKPVVPVHQRNNNKRKVCLESISRDSDGSTSGTSS